MKKELRDYACGNTYGENIEELNHLLIGKLATIISHISSILKDCSLKSEVLAEFTILGNQIINAILLNETELENKDYFIENIISKENVKACMLIAGIVTPEDFGRIVKVISERGTEEDIEMFESVYPGVIQKEREKMNQLIKNFHVPVNIEDNSLYE